MNIIFIVIINPLIITHNSHLSICSICGLTNLCMLSIDFTHFIGCKQLNSCKQTERLNIPTLIVTCLQCKKDPTLIKHVCF